MSLWGRVSAALYEPVLARSEDAGLRERRARLLSAAGGRVIEIGAGTGLNLPHYGPQVSELVLCEPEAPMARRLAPRAARAAPSTRLVRAPAEALPFADDEFDCAVATLVLCTVSDPDAALAELRRVLRPGGRLLFLEHVRAQDPALARVQDRWHPLWVRVGCGCHCNRPTLATINASGFDVQQVEQGRMPKALPIVRPLIVGQALAPAAAAA